MTVQARSSQLKVEPAIELRTVFEREFAWVFRTLRRLGIREADTEDLVHEVFVAFHQSLPTYDPSRPIRSWLFGIAFRVASDHRRRASNRRELLIDPEEPADSRPLAEAQLGSARARALVLEALDALPADRRAVFVLHELDEVPVTEIARTLDIPLNTAYSRLRIARQEFAARARRLTGKESP